MRDLTNPKLKGIVETAQGLFWKFGFRRVTIQEICREAGVSKMTFYKHFKNKEDLLKFVLDLITEHRMAVYRTVMDRDVPYREKMKDLVRMKAAQVEDLSQEFFLDFHKHASPEMRKHIDAMVAKGMIELMADYTAAQKKGDIRKDIKPEFIIYFLNHMNIMLKDDNLIRLYESPQELIMELTNFFIYGLLPRDGE
jgi:AcrR family transcriptional regulator